MLGLNRNTLLIGHKPFQNVKYTKRINELNELQRNDNFLDTWCVCDKNVKPPQQQNLQSYIKILAEAGNLTREFNPGPLAPNVDALPMDHQVNWEYWLLSSYLTVSTQCI